MIISLIIFLYMFIVPISTVYIHIDELYTTKLMRYTFDYSWNIIVNDVHPPLYYFIYMGLINFLKALNVSFDLLYISKIISIIPYGLILLVSLTKIRKEYNWLVAGLFSISIGIMGNFFIQFLTIRMYGWGLLFLILSFIYMGDIYKNFDTKSWVLFTLFSILSIYTHNIILISIGILYVLLFLHIFLLDMKLNKKIFNIKMWLASVGVIIFSYLPWFLILLNQMSGGHGNSVNGVTLDNFLNCLKGFATMDNNLFVFVIALILLIMIFGIVIVSYSKEKNVKNSYILSGLLLFFATLLLSTILLPFVFGAVMPRYLVPIYGVLWLVISIFVGDIDHFKVKIEKNKILNTEKLLIIFLMLILILGIFSCISLNNTMDIQYNLGKTEQSTLQQINNENSIVIYNMGWYHESYNFYLNNSKQIILDSTDKIAMESNITDILTNNPDKNVYLFFRLTNENKDEANFNGLKTQLLSENGYAHIFGVTLENNTK